MTSSAHSPAAELPLFPWQSGDCASVASLDSRSFAEVVFDGGLGSFRPTCLAAADARWALLGPSPDAHHAFLLGLHAVNAGLLGWAARRLGLSPSRAAVAGALFLLSPLRLDAAANIHAACDLLVTTFCLLFVITWRPHRPTAVSVGSAAVIALLAATTKETGFVVVASCAAMIVFDRSAVAPERHGWRPRRGALLSTAALAVVLAGAFVARATVLRGIAGTYAEGLWATGPGLRGVLAGLFATAVPVREVLDLSDLSRSLLPGPLRRPLMVALASVVALGAWAAARRLPPSRVRRFALVFTLSAAVPFLFSVNERSAYVAGVGAALFLATLPLPTRLHRIGPVLLAALLVVGAALRVRAYVDAGALAHGLRREALRLGEASGASAVYIAGSPVRLRGARSSPVSECHALLDSSGPQVIGVFRGVSDEGVGPALNGARVRARAGFVFHRAYCGPGDGLLPDGLEAEVGCVDGSVSDIALSGRAAQGELVLVWTGGQTLESLVNEDLP